MIKNKKEIVKEAEEKLKKAIREYADVMDKKSDEEYYPIDVIEEDLVNIQKIAREVINETTENLINAVSEEKEIVKKTRVYR